MDDPSPFGSRSSASELERWHVPCGDIGNCRTSSWQDMRSNWVTRQNGPIRASASCSQHHAEQTPNVAPTRVLQEQP
eukprot:3892702-Amphidinium_carterae.1